MREIKLQLQKQKHVVKLKLNIILKLAICKWEREAHKHTQKILHAIKNIPKSFTWRLTQTLNIH